ncbi:LPS export ABC transporter periplasmic protein LptC [Sulfuricystis multivorans]|uniref:LPS export ABC transporter periplasmic protein LptC n=1 Tax=Sulfuricystis multivorans TaxID=2211108 RepID=UPI000F81620C|nr:LPS export ABC transporter periplasmic protein LptC [Sulfuricystis multivorans]
MPARPRTAANLFPLLLAGILAALSYWLELASRAPEVAKAGKLRHDPDTIVENFEVRRFDPQGALQHTLTARQMVHYPDDDTAVVFEPRIVWHRPPPTTLEAREAHISSRGEHVALIDDVRITRDGSAGKPQTILTTARMDVWPDDELAKSTQPVTITQGASRIRGEGGMNVDQKSLIYVLEGPVEGVFFRTASPPAATRTARPALASRAVATRQAGVQAKPKAGLEAKSKPSSSRR